MKLFIAMESVFLFCRDIYWLKQISVTTCKVGRWKIFLQWYTHSDVTVICRQTLMPYYITLVWRVVVAHQWNQKPIYKDLEATLWRGKLNPLYLVIQHNLGFLSNCWIPPYLENVTSSRPQSWEKMPE